MAENINKVVFGGATLIDLTGDSVTPETLAEGITAHDKSGNQIVGTMQSGGGGGSLPSASKKEVNFYDYDGTILYSYTVAEAAALTELPALPSHDGLICQGWNWSLDDIKEMGQAVDVGAMYITDDGKTRIYIHLEDGRTSPLLGCCPNGTVTVDWGDGTEPDVLTGTSVSTVAWTPTHEYAAPGDYVISLTVDGAMGFYGSSTSNEWSAILRYSSSADARNYVYRNAVRKVEIGSGVTSISSRAFQNCYSLANVVIPNRVTVMNNYAFSNCYSLANVVIPNSVTSIGGYAFQNCYSLENVVIPNSVTVISVYAFYYCYSLANVVIPNSVTVMNNYAFSNCYSLANVVILNSVTNISTNVFYYCYSLANVVIPNSVTSISSNAFQNCYGVRYYDFTRHTSVPTLSATSAFSGIAADCEIRVPAALAEEWKAATNWATYADYIVGV